MKQEETHKDFFIDFHEKDSDLAEWIAWELEAAGYTIIFEKWDFLPGTNRELNIQRATTKAKRIIVVLSPDYLNEYRPELFTAFLRNRTGEHDTLLPVQVREARQHLPKDLETIVPIDLVGLDEGAARQVLLEGVSGRRLKPSITPIFHAVPVPPTPLIHFPYDHNQFFTGRHEIFDQLGDALSAGKIAALTQSETVNNSGGVGKTQVAIEYVYRHSKEYQAVLWIDAASEETLIADFSIIAVKLHLPEKDALDKRLAVTAVKHWLTERSDFKWLLIFDNVEKLKIVRGFIPLASKGHVLMITRSQAVSQGMGDTVFPIRVKEMEPNEGALLLLRQADIVLPDATLVTASEADRNKAEEVSQVMKGHPLALVQVGAYIRATAFDLSDYLDIYQRQETPLLGEHRTDIPEHLAPVIIAWSLSFDAVRITSPAAVELLRLCAFLSPDAISPKIIIEGDPQLDLNLPIQPPATKEDTLNKAFEELVRFSLLRRKSNSELLTIHPLLQTVLKNEMTRQEQQQWVERTVRIINRAFPHPEFVTWQRCRQCLEHAQACYALIKQWKIKSLEAAQLLDHLGYFLGYYMQDSTLFLKAEDLCKRALRIREKKYGSNHPDVATSKNHLALLYDVHGKPDLAKSFYQEAVAIWKQLLESQGQSPQVEYLDGLATLYKMHREYALAESLYQQALNIQQQHLRPQDRHLLPHLSNLAEMYLVQGKYIQAEPLYRRILSIHEQTLEAGHPDIIRSLETLAELYTIQGAYDKAEIFYHRILAIHKQSPGSDHIYTTHSLNNLALLYYTQGKYAQAERLYKRILDILEQRLGREDPSIVQSLNNLALLYRIQGKYDQAESLYKRALNMQEQIFGLKDPHIVLNLSNLGLLYYLQCKYSEAEDLYRRALEIQKQSPEAHHPGITYHLNNLALFCRIQGKYEEAKNFYQELQEIQEQTLGPDHPHVAKSLNSLAEIHYIEGKYDEAEQLARRALEIQEQTLEADHPDIAQSLYNLADLYRVQNKKYKEADEYYQRALAIQERMHGSMHLDVANMLNNLIALYYAQGEPSLSDPLYKRIVAIREHVLGPEHLSVAHALSNLATSYYDQGKYSEAEPLYQRALIIREQILGREHLLVAAALENYANLLLKTKQDGEATKLLAHARAIRSKYFKDFSLP